MDAVTFLTINVFVLLAILVILVLLAVFIRPAPFESEVSQDLENIKNQIEHEAEIEAEEELMPYKPPRLDRPTRRRL